MVPWCHCLVLWCHFKVPWCHCMVPWCHCTVLWCHCMPWCHCVTVQPIGLQYVATMWWSTFTITSIGPAYIAATTVEQIFNCVYALFGMAAVC